MIPIRNFIWRSRKWCLVACLSVMLVGWVCIPIRDRLISDQVLLKLECTVPGELPEVGIGWGKGDDKFVTYPKKEYPYAFESGWVECLHSFTRVASLRPINPFDSSVGPSLKQVTGYTSNAQADGFKDCHLQIMKLSSQYGVSTVRRILRRKYGSSWDENRASARKLSSLQPWSWPE